MSRTHASLATPLGASHGVGSDTVRAFLSQAELELRTPLALIQGYIETLRSGVVKGGEQLARCLEVMDRNSRRLMHVIDDMKIVSTVVTPSSAWLCDAANLRQCIGLAVEWLAPELETRQIVIEHHIPQGRARLLVDREKLHLILLKLFESILRGRASALRISIQAAWEATEMVLSVQATSKDQVASCLDPVCDDFMAPTFGELDMLLVRHTLEVSGGRLELRTCDAEGSDCYLLALPSA